MSNATWRIPNDDCVEDNCNVIKYMKNIAPSVIFEKVKRSFWLEGISVYIILNKSIPWFGLYMYHRLSINCPAFSIFNSQSTSIHWFENWLVPFGAKPCLEAMLTKIWARFLSLCLKLGLGASPIREYITNVTVYLIGRASSSSFK